MTSIELLSMPKSQRILYKIGAFFKNIGLGIWNFFKRIPKYCKKFWKLIKKPFTVLFDAFAYGDWKTRLSFLILGFGQLFRKEVAKGILLILFETAFIAFMVTTGVPHLSKLATLGSVAYIDIGGVSFNPNYDNSFIILLISIISIIFIGIFAGVWYSQIKHNKLLQDMERVGRYSSNLQFIKDLSQRDYHKTLLAFPITGVVIFTIIPIIFMVLVAFTNYDNNHMAPSRLFDWVGFNNFSSIFGKVETGSNIVFKAFGEVLLWTLLWAFFATFSNYFLGMIVAILINTKGIKLKKLWRTVLVTTIAVPQFISLLLLNRMFQDNGIINELLIKNLHWISEPIHWLTDYKFNALLPKVMIILINTWVGIPYTMLICTGLLMNIPEDLYESAKIDGASPVRMYMKITLPYMLFVTAPYLISQFVGNINNFNVIYLLSGGQPIYVSESGVTTPPIMQNLGRTDLLITWLYKLSVESVDKRYGEAGVISILIFALVATLSLIFYSRTNSVKNEEDFQ